MKASDELFQLIRTLTSSEKRYFKTNAKRENPNSNYLQLFDAVDGQKEYDEDKLKKKYAGKKFIKYLSAEKNYLHEQIMKSMRAFHVDRTIDNKINDLLQDEAFYRAKGLNDLRKKTIEKAKKLAEEYERFHLLQEVFFREIDFVEEFSDKELEEPVRDLIDALDQVNQHMSLQVLLFSKDKELFSIYRSGADLKDDSVIRHLGTLRTDVENVRNRLGDSLRLQTLYNWAISSYCNCIGNQEKSFEKLLLNYNLFNGRPSHKQQYLHAYRILLSNLLGRAHASGREGLFDELLAELRELPMDSFNSEGEVFQNVFFLEHLRLINKGDLEKALQLVPDIEHGMVKYESKINKARMLSFQFNFMVMYFLMHRFKEAQIWAEKILEDKSEIKRSVTTITRILYPIIHFELGHGDLVENLTRAAYRYLLKLKRIHGFERLMINYLKGIPLSPDTDEFNEKLIDLSTQLENMKNDPSQNPGGGFEEVELWVRSRLENVKMSSLL